MPEVELLFLGTGTSAGVPMIGCDCAVCASVDPRDKRSRPSVVISYAGPESSVEEPRAVRVLVDTTPELRLQCVNNRVMEIEAVAFTHGHADHIMGLDDVRRFNTIRGGPLDVWADGRTHHTLGACFGYAFEPPNPEAKVFRPHLVRRYIDGPFEIGGVTWRPVPLMHGDQPILGFRVGNVAYCTDVSRIPEESFALLEGLDVLVLGALGFRPHPTHFSIEQAIAASRRIRPRRTYFTHIAHQVAHAATTEQFPAGVHLAFDGLRLRSPSQGAGTE
jgi:phosphoribosyl 1,2-cyclic phosphate phosphodiesterase